MEEKVVCKGIHHSPKTLYTIITGIAGLLFVIPFVMAAVEMNKFSKSGLSYSYWLSDNQLTVPFILVAIALFVYLIILKKLFSQNEITVTDKRVYGKAAFGKRVDLPLDAISAVGTSIFRAITVSTASGVIKFYMIENRDELHNAISQLLVARQGKEKSINQTTIKQEIPQSNADELKKFKDLLDSGIITQEEFDAKKKQLLGL